jgi:hypothetical protein
VNEFKEPLPKHDKPLQLNLLPAVVPMTIALMAHSREIHLMKPSGVDHTSPETVSHGMAYNRGGILLERQYLASWP